MEEKKKLWSSYDEAAKKELHEINEKYKACLDAGKTERECVKLAVVFFFVVGFLVFFFFLFFVFVFFFVVFCFFLFF